MAVAMESSVELRSHRLFSRMTAHYNCQAPGTEIWLTKGMGGKNPLKATTEGERVSNQEVEGVCRHFCRL